MKCITREQATEQLEVMTIEQSIDGGFAITQHGHNEDVPTIIISPSRGASDCYIQ